MELPTFAEPDFTPSPGHTAPGIPVPGKPGECWEDRSGISTQKKVFLRSVLLGPIAVTVGEGGDLTPKGEDLRPGVREQNYGTWATQSLRPPREEGRSHVKSRSGHVSHLSNAGRCADWLFKSAPNGWTMVRRDREVGRPVGIRDIASGPVIFQHVLPGEIQWDVQPLLWWWQVVESFEA